MCIRDQCESALTHGLWINSQKTSWAVRSHESSRLICTSLKRRSSTVATTINRSEWVRCRPSQRGPCATGLAILRRIQGCVFPLVVSANGKSSGWFLNPKPASSRITRSTSGVSLTTFCHSWAISLLARSMLRNLSTRQGVFPSSPDLKGDQEAYEWWYLSLIHISEPTRQAEISY